MEREVTILLPSAGGRRGCRRTPFRTRIFFSLRGSCAPLQSGPRKRARRLRRGASFCAGRRTERRREIENHPRCPTPPWHALSRTATHPVISSPSDSFNTREHGKQSGQHNLNCLIFNQIRLLKIVYVNTHRFFLKFSDVCFYAEFAHF